MLRSIFQYYSLPNQNIAVTLEGGYDCSYSAVTGNTIFNGTMTISDGTVTIGDYIFGN